MKDERNECNFITHYFVVYGSVATLTLLLYWSGTYRFSVLKSLSLPGPKPWPFLGNILEMKKYGGLHAMLFENMKLYGKIFAIYIGRLPAIVVVDPDALKQILVKDFSSFRNRSDAGRPPPPLECNLLAAKNEQWKRIRRILTPCYTSGKMKQMIPLMEDAVNVLMKKLEDVADTGPTEVIFVLCCSSLSAFCLRILLQQLNEHKICELTCTRTLGEQPHFGQRVVTTSLQKQNALEACTWASKCILAATLSTKLSFSRPLRKGYLKSCYSDKFVRIHSCNQHQTTCMASANGNTRDGSTKLTMLKKPSTDNVLRVCFQVTHNGTDYALQIIPHNQVLFQRLSGTDCTSNETNVFERKVLHNERCSTGNITPVQFISTKHGLPANTKYLALNVTTGSLFLTYKNYKPNRWIYL